VIGRSSTVSSAKLSKPSITSKTLDLPEPFEPTSTVNGRTKSVDGSANEMVRNVAPTLRK
jgi:hypothetical protein